MSDGDTGRNVIYLPDAEVLVDRGPSGFSDSELVLILAAIVLDG